MGYTGDFDVVVCNWSSRHLVVVVVLILVLVLSHSRSLVFSYQENETVQYDSDAFGDPASLYSFENPMYGTHPSGESVELKSSAAEKVSNLWAENPMRLHAQRLPSVYRTNPKSRNSVCVWFACLRFKVKFSSRSNKCWELSEVFGFYLMIHHAFVAYCRKHESSKISPIQFMMR